MSVQRDLIIGYPLLRVFAVISNEKLSVSEKKIIYGKYIKSIKRIDKHHPDLTC